MDKDKAKYETQSGGHVKEGHQESDVSVKAIVWSGVFLAVGGFFAFVLMIGMIHLLEYMEVKSEPKLTPVQQQLLSEREGPKEGLGKAVPTHKGEVKPAPDWYGRGKIEAHLRRTFNEAAPLLQYDDEHDMVSFFGSEQEWLNSTGKSTDGTIHIPISRAMEILSQRGLPQVSGPFQPSNVGAPSAAYPTGASGGAGASQPGQTPAAGVKK